MLDGFAHHLLAFDLGQQGAGDGIGAGQSLQQIFTALAILRSQPPFPVVALVGGHPHQPALQGFGVAQPGQFVEQVQADRLEDIGGVLGRRAVTQGDGVNQVLVTIEKCIPGALVAGQTLRHQARVSPLRTGRAHRPAPAFGRSQYNCSTFQVV